MPRMLNNKPCEMIVLDRISNTRMTLFYRLPTTDERVKYINANFKRQGNKIVNNVTETRIKYGAAILMGFSDGAFETDRGPLSSDAQSPHYDPAWKDYVIEFAPDIVGMLAVNVFETSIIPALADSEEEGETEKNDS